MKNIIPIVIMVVLASAAVFAVRRLIKPGEGETRKTYVEVVMASEDIEAGKEIPQSKLKKRMVDAASLPANAISYAQQNRVVGQKATRKIPKNDYVLLTDVVEFTTQFDMLVPEGTWAVPITFADATLVEFLEPNMEISILGTFTTKHKVSKLDATEKPEVIEEEATSVVFPCVRILDIGKGDGIRRESTGRGNGTVIVALTPQQSATLVAAQRKMDLYPALRKRGDRSSLKRQDVGIVNETTFTSLKSGLDAVVIPDNGK